MGRKKIQIQHIKDDRNRQVTFLKRKHGLMKKAYELSVLCNCEVALVIIPSNNKLIQFSSSDMNTLLKIYKENDLPREIRSNQDFIENGENDQLHGSDNDESIIQQQPHNVVTSNNNILMSTTTANMLQPHTQQQQSFAGAATHIAPTQNGMSFSYTSTAGYTMPQAPIQPQQMMQHHVAVNSYDIYQQHQQNQQMYMLQQQHHQQRLQQQQMYGDVRQPNLQYPQQQMTMLTQPQPQQLSLPQPSFLNNNTRNDCSNSSTTTPSLYHSPNSSPNTIQQDISPHQSPKSEPGTPDKRPKLKVTIPNAAATYATEDETTKKNMKPAACKLSRNEDEINLNYTPYSSLPLPSALPSQFVQNLPSPSMFYPEFYQPNFIMSPIHSNSAAITPATTNSVNNPFLIPTSPFRESGIRTSETASISNGNHGRKRSIHQSFKAENDDLSMKKTRVEV